MCIADRARLQSRKRVRLTASSGALCMTSMWLTVLQRILLSLALVLLAGVAFGIGAFVARSNQRDARPLELPTTGAEQARQARVLAEEALAARFAGDNEKALGLFDQASAADPQFRGLHLQRGLTQFFAGRFSGAEAAARASLAAKEELADAYALLVLCAASRAAAGEATDKAQIDEWTEKSRGIDPLSSFIHYARGEYARASGEPREAVEYYRKALERVPPTDCFLVSTIKAGLSGLRLRQATDPKPVMPSLDDANVPPEWLFFAAAQALLDGDMPTARAWLLRAKTVVRPEIFSALLKDSFFQDYLPDANFSDPQIVDPP